MKKLVLTLGSVFLLVLLISIIGFPINSSLLGDYQCPLNTSITYFFHEGCGACTKVEPIVNELLSKGCNLTKIDVTLNEEEVIRWNILYTPTFIICGEKYVGALNADSLKTIINNTCP